MFENTHNRESEFHDEWAASTPAESIRVREAFESPTALENQWILRQMGGLTGKHLLDIGCGLGESSVYFALQGAEVTATDISAGMIQTANALARLHHVTLTTVVTPGESLNGIESEKFDLVYIANTIHHIRDKITLLKEIQRVLKPGGHFISWDPIAYNPIINRYRRMATEVRTDDETPLRYSDLQTIRQHFPGARTRFFWMSALLLFLKYYYVDKVGPNQTRYWKKIYQPQKLGWWKPFAWLDGALLCRLPLLRWWSWNVVIIGRKPLLSRSP